jgi:hypothetical protein
MTMTNPSDSDWINAAKGIWNADIESDVWIPESNDELCSILYPEEDGDSTVGVWVTGARVWVSRSQLDAYLCQQRGEGNGPDIPEITYFPPDSTATGE